MVSVSHIGATKHRVFCPFHLRSEQPCLQQNSVGFVMNILMPGHAITNLEETKKDLDQLEKLIIAHDAIFLLTDSREARWLPTVLGATYGKV